MARQGLLRRVQDEFDWEGFVEEYATVKRVRSSAELRICCPSCEESKYKLYVNPDKGVFYCFKCSFNSKNKDVFDFVSKTMGITRHQALTKLCQEFAQTTPEDEEFETRVRAGVAAGEAPTPLYGSLNRIRTIPGLPKGLVPLTERTSSNAKYWDYLVGRGLTPQEIQAAKYHYAAPANLPVYDSQGRYRGSLNNRVVVPIYGGQNQLVSWQGRIIDDAESSMKYLSAPESEMAKTVWPYVKPKGNQAVLVEGVLDSLAVRRAGFPAYASFTKKISPEQVLRLKLWGIERLIVLWDRKDAKKDIIAAVKDLRMRFQKVYVVRPEALPVEQDAGDMLTYPEGSAKLTTALSDLVDTADDLEYARWQLTF